MSEKVTTKKELKEALKSEVSPLLIGLRNELKNLIASVQASEKGNVKFRIAKDGTTIPVIGGAKGDDGKDGKDAVIDYEHILKETLKRVEKLIPVSRRGRPGKDGKNGFTPVKGLHYRDGKDGRDGIDGKTIIKEKSLTADEILEILAVEGIPARMIIGLEKLLKNVASNIRPWSPGGFGGAGINQINVSFYTETPQGLIDGVNVTYTVTAKISAIINLAINGQYLHPTTDYSFSGKTITLTSPLDASLAGKPFTITYV